MTTRDPELEAALGTYCTAPDHQDGFSARLEGGMTRIDRELASTAGGWLHRARTRCGAHRRLLAGVAAVAAMAVVAAVLVNAFPEGRHTVRSLQSAVHELQYPPAASAAEAAANVRMALGNARTLSADVTEHYRIVKGPPESTWQEGWTTADWWARAHIYSDAEVEAMYERGEYEGPSTAFPTEHEVLSADGKWCADCPDGSPPGDPGRVVYHYAGDEAAGILTSVDGPILRDTSLGEPDDVRNVIELSLQFIRSSTLATMAHGDLHQTTYDGRPALTISCAIAPVPIEGLNMDGHQFDAVRFTIDQETWLIVCTSYLLRGQVIWETRLTNVRVNEPLGRRAQRELSALEAAGDDAPSQHFLRVSFSDAAHRFSTRPLEPRVLPSAFHPFAAAVADRARFTWWSEDGSRNQHYWPQGREVTQLSYRAGFLQFVVTTRSQPAADEPLPADLLVTDPFVNESEADGGENNGTVEAVKLQGGAWSGVTAYLVTPLLDPPHLWAWHDGVLITVGGDLTRSQVLSVANSLEPME
jgi:hypothetical protein